MGVEIEKPDHSKEVIPPKVEKRILKHSPAPDQPIIRYVVREVVEEKHASSKITTGAIGRYGFVDAKADVYYRKGNNFFSANGSAIYGPDVPYRLAAFDPNTGLGRPADNYPGQIHTVAGHYIKDEKGRKLYVTIEGDSAFQTNKTRGMSQRELNQVSLNVTSKHIHADHSEDTVKGGALVGSDGPGLQFQASHDNGKGINGGRKVGGGLYATPKEFGGTLYASARDVKMTEKNEAIFTRKDVEATALVGKYGVTTRLAAGGDVTKTKPQGQAGGSNYGTLGLRPEFWSGYRNQSTLGNIQLYANHDISHTDKKGHDINSAEGINFQFDTKTAYMPPQASLTYRHGSAEYHTIVTNEGRFTDQPKSAQFWEAGGQAIFTPHGIIPLPKFQYIHADQTDRSIKVTEDMKTHEAAGQIAGGYYNEAQGEYDFQHGRKTKEAAEYNKTFAEPYRVMLQEIAKDGKIHFKLEGHEQFGIPHQEWSAAANHPKKLAALLVEAQPFLARKYLVDQKMGLGNANLDYARECIAEKGHGYMAPKFVADQDLSNSKLSKKQLEQLRHAQEESISNAEKVADFRITGLPEDLRTAQRTEEFEGNKEATRREFDRDFNRYAKTGKVKIDGEVYTNANQIANIMAQKGAEGLHLAVKDMAAKGSRTDYFAHLKPEERERFIGLLKEGQGYNKYSTAQLAEMVEEQATHDMAAEAPKPRQVSEKEKTETVKTMTDMGALPKGLTGIRIDAETNTVSGFTKPITLRKGEALPPESLVITEVSKDRHGKDVVRTETLDKTSAHHLIQSIGAGKRDFRIIGIDKLSDVEVTNLGSNGNSTFDLRRAKVSNTAVNYAYLDEHGKACVGTFHQVSHSHNTIDSGFMTTMFAPPVSRHTASHPKQPVQQQPQPPAPPPVHTKPPVTPTPPTPVHVVCPPPPPHCTPTQGHGGGGIAPGNNLGPWYHHQTGTTTTTTCPPNGKGGNSCSGKGGHGTNGCSGKTGGHGNGCNGKTGGTKPSTPAAPTSPAWPTSPLSPTALRNPANSTSPNQGTPGKPAVLSAH